MDIDVLRRRLRERGQRMTTQRELVLKTFLEEEEKCLSVDDVYSSVVKERMKLSKTTVIRIMEMLTEIGILRKVVYSNLVKYELPEEEEIEKYHIICNKCGKAIDSSIKKTGSLIKSAEKKTGFKIDDVHIRLYGLCENCRNESAK